MSNGSSIQGRSVDPFFSIPDDPVWNACIGPQGGEENYVDGYIDAALELANVVIEKDQFIDRDTLVLPILYNARHGVELCLKFVIKILREANVIQKLHPVNHNIESHWKHLCDADVGDEAMRGFFEMLGPYINSLASIDEDGQQLRYATDVDGQASLQNRPLANIAVIRDSLVNLQFLLKTMKDRVLALKFERAIGVYTEKCSRKDLMEIARMLPHRSLWSDDVFVEARDAIKLRYKLDSNRKLKAAIDAIESNREMRLLIGVESELAHLTDAHAQMVVERWSIFNSASHGQHDLGMDYFNDANRSARMRDLERCEAACRELAGELSLEELSDLEVIYYIGRDGGFSEEYEGRLECTKRRYRLNGDVVSELRHVFTKTNLLKCLSKGLRVLGKQQLGNRLIAIRSDVS